MDVQFVTSESDPVYNVPQNSNYKEANSHHNTQTESGKLNSKIINNTGSSTFANDIVTEGPTESDDSILNELTTLSSTEYIFFALKILENEAIDSSGEGSSKSKSTNESEDESIRNELREFMEHLVCNNSKEKISEMVTKVKTLQSFNIEQLQTKFRSKSFQNMLGDCNKSFSQAAIWIKTHLEEESNKNILKRKVYAQYCEFCGRNKINPLSSTDFEILLKQLYPNVNQIRIGPKGRWQFCYNGIKNRSHLYPPTLPNLSEKQAKARLNPKFFELCNHKCSNDSSAISTDEDNSIKTIKDSSTASSLKKQCKLNNRDTSSDTDAAVSLIPKDNTFNNSTGEYSNATQVSIDIKNDREAIPGLQARTNNTRKKYKAYYHFSVKTLTENYKNIIIPPSLYKHNVNPSVILTNHEVDNWYRKQLLYARQLLSNLNFHKKINNATSCRVSCKCCKITRTFDRGDALKLHRIKTKLLKAFNIPDNGFSASRHTHPSVKKLLERNSNLILPKQILNVHINPVVNLNKNAVLSWYVHRVDYLKFQVALINEETISTMVEVPEDSIMTTKTDTGVPSRQTKARLMNFCELDSDDSDSTVDYFGITSSSSSSSSDSSSSDFDIDMETRSVSSASESGWLKRKRDHCKETTKELQPPLKKDKIDFNVQTRTTISNDIPPPPPPLSLPPATQPVISIQSTNEPEVIIIEETPPIPPPATTETSFVCRLCLDTCKSQRDLMVHESKHLGCRTCKRKLRDLDIMREHLKKHCTINRTKGKPFLTLFPVECIKSVKEKYSEAFTDFHVVVPYVKGPFKRSRLEYYLTHKNTPKATAKSSVQPKPVIKYIIPNIYTSTPNISETSGQKNKQFVLKYVPVGDTSTSTASLAIVSTTQTPPLVARNSNNCPNLMKFMQITVPTTSTSGISVMSSKPAAPTVSQINNPNLNLSNCQNLIKFMQIVGPSTSTTTTTTGVVVVPPKQTAPTVTTQSTICQSAILTQKQLPQINNTCSNNVVVLNHHNNVTSIPMDTSNLLCGTYLLSESSSKNITLTATNVPISTTNVNYNLGVNSVQLQQSGNIMQIVNPPNLIPCSTNSSSTNTLLTLQQDHSYYQAPVLQQINSNVLNLNQSVVLSTNNGIVQSAQPPQQPLNQQQRTTVIAANSNVQPSQFRIRVKDIKELS